ncbi:unnamed protein product [Polarella glacialis]|uniref:Uncharacterized protein n=1 Tax=Polarella glacialis TaxID=89957 RepID=A0A813DFL2_POLGL|nr:unnamed protein product [Polarella glacialis]
MPPISSRERTEKFSKEPLHGDNLDKRLEEHLERVRRSLSERRQKEEEASRRGKAVLLEQGFNQHFSTTKKGSAKQSKHQPARQLPLLAAKIRRELVGSDSEEEAAEPIWKLLERESHSHTPPECQSNFALGEEVEVRDRDMAEWRVGFVSATSPLRVMLSDWDQAFQWDFVQRRSASKLQRPPDQAAQMPQVIQPEQSCTCGYRFLADALFCSKCGRQRACEQSAVKLKNNNNGNNNSNHNNNNNNNLKQQLPPRPPTALGPGSRVRAPARQNSGDNNNNNNNNNNKNRINFNNNNSNNNSNVAASPRGASGQDAEPIPGSPACTKCGDYRHPSCECPFESGAYRVEVHSGWEQTISVSEGGCEVKAAQPQPVPSLSRRNEAPVEQRSWSSGEASAGHRQQWQQMTVPILAENGQVIALSPAAECSQKVWQQHCVPILGETGEVVALRPVMGSRPMPEWKQSVVPIFDKWGEIIAVPSGGQCQWQQNTVPILGENGEVIALRPAASEPWEWKQMVIPIFGDTGVVVGLCPVGNLKQWEQLTVPLVTEKGEVVGLRPSGDRYEMPGWAERPGAAAGARERRTAITTTTTTTTPTQIRTTTTLLSPARHEEPPLVARDRTRESSLEPERLGRSLAPSSVGSDRTWLPPAPMSARGSDDRHNNKFNISIKSSISSTPSNSVKTLRPSDLRASFTERGSSEVGSESSCDRWAEVAKSAVAVVAKPRKGAGAEPGGEAGRKTEPGAGDDGLRVESVSGLRSHGASILDLSASENIECGLGEQTPKASAAAASSPPVPPVHLQTISSSASNSVDSASQASLRHILRSASADSLASFNEILRMANAAQQATPEGHLLHVLREALSAPPQEPPQATGIPANGVSAGAMMYGGARKRLVPAEEPPEADELLVRLRQLPELWRNTILAMLEQAEAVQPPLDL